jgi:hypothetical protein
MTFTNISSLRSCLTGHVASAGGFYWSYDSRATHDAPPKAVKKVYRFALASDLKGANKCLEEYSSAKVAAMDVGISYSALTACLNGYSSKSGGFRWSRSKTDFPEKPPEARKVYVFVEGRDRPLAGFNSPRHAAIQNNSPGGVLNNSPRITERDVLRACATGECLHGHYWSYDSYSRKKVVQLTKPADPNQDPTYIATHDSVAAAYKKTGIPASNISNAANGKLKSAGGYTWSFDDIY